jgi:glycerol-3-phosphate acyltransferase PlsY
MNTSWILAWLLCYLCGSVPFALIIGRCHGIDIRTVGSGNVGATNVGRALGRKWGFLCFALDVLKGALPVLVSGLWMGVAGRWDLQPHESLPWLACPAFAMAGHVFPVWLKFKGGKGVATGLGVLLGFWPILTLAGVVGAVTWVLLLKLTRYVSVASVGAALSLPALIIVQSRYRHQPLTQAWPLLAVTVAMALLVIVRHRANLKRLAAGTEPKVGVKAH